VEAGVLLDRVDPVTAGLIIQSLRAFRLLLDRVDPATAGLIV